MVRAGVKMCINTVTFCGHGCKKLLERKCERLHFRIFIKKIQIEGEMKGSGKKNFIELRKFGNESEKERKKEKKI
jgi:hypothetical protein